MENKALRKDRLKKRITELDLFRGIAVIFMILDHCMYDLWGFMPDLFVGYPTALYNFAAGYWNWEVRTIVRYVVLFVFFSLTGISCSFSKSNLKRGLKLMGVALLLTIGTYFVVLFTDDIDNLIVFGVLHMIAFTIILISLIEKITKNKWVYLAIGVILIIVGLLIDNPEKLDWVSFTEGNFFELFFNAFIGKYLIGADCFSFPFHGGQIFIGVFLGKLLYKERRPLLFKGEYSNNPLTFVGRHALIVYFFHQILIPIILGIILLIAGYTLAM